MVFSSRGAQMLRALMGCRYHDQLERRVLLDSLIQLEREGQKSILVRRTLQAASVPPLTKDKPSV